MQSIWIVIRNKYLQWYNLIKFENVFEILFYLNRNSSDAKIYRDICVKTLCFFLFVLWIKIIQTVASTIINRKFRGLFSCIFWINPYKNSCLVNYKGK